MEKGPDVKMNVLLGFPMLEKEVEIKICVDYFLDETNKPTAKLTLYLPAEKSGKLLKILRSNRRLFGSALDEWWGEKDPKEPYRYAHKKLRERQIFSWVASNLKKREGTTWENLRRAVENEIDYTIETLKAVIRENIERELGRQRIGMLIGHSEPVVKSKMRK